jgi:plastocyanin
MSRYSLYYLIATAAFAMALAGCGRQADLGPVANIESAKAIRKVLAAGSAGGEETAVAASTGTGWATLRGQFVYDGTPPQRQPYNVTKEHNICAPGGQAPLQEKLVVDQDSRGIQNVAIYLREASRVHDSAQPKAESVEFDQKVCVFLTHVMPVSVGQPIQIKNSDPTGHNTKIEGRANTFNQTIPAGGTIPFTPQREETAPAPVSCSIHPWMSAYLFPRKNGYVAVTDAEGRFEIANLPAGEPLELQVWHESGAAPGLGLVGATPDAPDVKWSNRGRVSISLQDGEEKEIKIVVPPSAFRG